MYFVHVHTKDEREERKAHWFTAEDGDTATSKAYGRIDDLVYPKYEGETAPAWTFNIYDEAELGDLPTSDLVTMPASMFAKVMASLARRR